MPESLTAMITRKHKIYNQLIISMLDKLSNINQWRKDFILETFVLFLPIRGRINFLQLARYGRHKEQRYRQQFEKQFDFLTFNKELVLSSGSRRFAIAFDPSYITHIAGKAVSNGEKQLTSGRVMNEYRLGTPHNVSKNKFLLINNDIIGEMGGSYCFMDPAFELWFRKSFLNKPYGNF